MTKQWTSWLAISLLLAAAFDIASTYVASPDLSDEANPAVIALGQTWRTVFAIKVIASLACLALFRWSLHVLHSRRERLSGLSGFACVMSHLFYKRQLSVSDFLLRGGIKDWTAYFSFMSLGVATGVVSAGITASIANSFQLIRSHEAVIVFWCTNGLLGTAIGAMLAYQFVTLNNNPEQNSDLHSNPGGHL